jgi:hypothetical protein
MMDVTDSPRPPSIPFTIPFSIPSNEEPSP